MATRQLRVVALLVALPALLGVVAACGTLIGIEDLGVEQASTTPDGGKRSDTGAPIDEPPPDASATGDVDTSVAPPPDGAMPAKRVFVTSSATTAKLDNHPGVAGADTLCMNAAASVAMTDNGRKWRAWISGNGQNAIDRITYDGPYYTLTDRRIVANRAQLASGSLDGPINITENRVMLSSSAPYAWTGTSANGDLGIDCNDWTFDSVSAVTFGIAGTFTESVDGKWTNNGGAGGGLPGWGCQLDAHLYCFEM